MKNSLKRLGPPLILALLVLFAFITTSSATPALRILTWDASRGRDDMILTDTREGNNIETLYQGLKNRANFGPTGTVKCDPSITYTGAIATGSLVSSGVRNYDIFFGNMIDPNSPVIPLSSDEAAELAAFINAGGIVYISGDRNGQGKTWDPLFAALGVSDHFNGEDISSGRISLPLVSTPITSGPFGDISGMYMGWTNFSSIATSSLTTVIKAGGNPATYPFLAEGTFGAGRLSVSADTIAHDFNTSSTANKIYMLNLLALGCQAPKLQIYQTVTPDVVTPGNTVTITLSITNLGDGAINNVVIKDLLPPPLMATGFTSSGLTLVRQSGASYVWQAGTLAGKASGTITINATVASNATVGAGFTNLATISGTDGQTTVSDDSSFILTTQNCYATFNNGGSVYRDLQEAVDAATVGATLKVAGYCAGVKTVASDQQTVRIDKNLTIIGGYSGSGWVYNPSLYPTTIDPLGKGRGITLGAVNVILNDLILTNGHTNGNGGAISASADSALTINRVTLKDNVSASGSGGGLATSGHLTATDSTFSGNSAYFAGGGALVQGQANITGCLFKDNRAISSEGGGLECYRTLKVTGSRFINNSSATHGGGLFAYGYEAGANRIVNSLFAGNSAVTRGAAISILSSSMSGLSGEIVHSTISGAGAVSAIFTPYGPLNVTNSIVDGYDSGIECFNSSSTSVGEDYNLFNVTTLFTGSGSGKITSGTNSLTGIPRFSNPSTGDYHLLAGSPAIDRGTDLGVTSDLDGRPRPQGTDPDMGAYEREALLPARIAGATPAYYVTLQAAHNAAASGSLIEAQERLFDETLTVGKILTLRGGYDGAYEVRGGVTGVKGIVVKGGAVAVDGLAVQ